MVKKSEKILKKYFRYVLNDCRPLSYFLGALEHFPETRFSTKLYCYYSDLCVQNTRLDQRGHARRGFCCSTCIGHFTEIWSAPAQVAPI